MIFIIDLVQNPRWGYKKREEKKLKFDFMIQKSENTSKLASSNENEYFFFRSNKICSKYELEEGKIII